MGKLVGHLNESSSKHVASRAETILLANGWTSQALTLVDTAASSLLATGSQLGLPNNHNSLQTSQHSWTGQYPHVSVDHANSSHASSISTAPSSSSVAHTFDLGSLTPSYPLRLPSASATSDLSGAPGLTLQNAHPAISSMHPPDVAAITFSLGTNYLKGVSYAPHNELLTVENIILLGAGTSRTIYRVRILKLFRINLPIHLVYYYLQSFLRRNSELDVTPFIAKTLRNGQETMHSAIESVMDMLELKHLVRDLKVWHCNVVTPIKIIGECDVYSFTF